MSVNSMGNMLSTNATSDGVGDNAWANPTNIYVQSDAAAATCAIGNGQNSEKLKAQDLATGNYLPTSAMLIGAVVRVRAKRAGGGTLAVAWKSKLIDDTDTSVGTGATVPPGSLELTTSYVTYVFGAQLHDWAGVFPDKNNDTIDWTHADVGYGIRFQNTGLNPDTVSVAWITIRFFWRDPVGRVWTVGPPSPSMAGKQYLVTGEVPCEVTHSPY